MTTSSIGRERDELDGLDGLESWDTIENFVFFTLKLDERQNSTRGSGILVEQDIGIAFGHFRDYV